MYVASHKSILCFTSFCWTVAQRVMLFAHTCIHLYRPIIMASFTLYTSLQTWAQSVIRLALVDLDVVSHKGGLLTVRERPGKGVVACGV